MSAKPIKWRYNLGTVLSQKCGKLLLTERFVRETTYFSKSQNKHQNKRQKWYRYECLTCGYKDGEVQESDLNKSVGCSCCRGLKVVSDVNALATLRPDLVPYFENVADAQKVTAKSNKLVRLVCPICGEQQTKKCSVFAEHGFHCVNCNSVATLRPDLVRYFVNRDLASKLTCGSHIKVELRCPQCGEIKNKTVKDLVNDGFACKKCSNGLSFGERYMRCFFNQLATEYIPEYSKANASWCENYRYDFYLPLPNTIVEVNGVQHYRERGSFFNSNTLKTQQQIDEYKKELALNNGVANYVIISSVQTNGLNMKKQILNSVLSSLFNLNNFDWRKCAETAADSLKASVCNYYNENKDMLLSEIAIVFHISRQSVQKYLLDGNADGFCDYKIGYDRQVYCNRLKSKNQVLEDEFS